MKSYIKNLMGFGFGTCLIILAVLSIGIGPKHASAQTPCYPYIATGPLYLYDSNNLPRTWLDLGGGKSMYIPNQTTPSLLQEMHFEIRNSLDPCSVLMNFSTDRAKVSHIVGATAYIANGPWQAQLVGTPPPNFDPNRAGVLNSFAYWGNDFTSTGATRIAQEDAVINSIAATNQMKLRVTTDFFSKESTVPATNCVKIAGNGPRKIVFRRATNWNTDTKTFLNAVNNTIENGFKTIDPFKTYFDRFSFYVDLKKYVLVPDSDPNFPGLYKISPGPCGSDAATEIVFQTDNNAGGAWAEFDLGMVYVNFDKDTALVRTFGNGWDLSTVIIHEVGHTLGRLSDEYYLVKALGSKPFIHFGFPNGQTCTQRPLEDYTDNSNPLISLRYGSLTSVSCGYFAPTGPDDPPYHKPSNISIMNSGTSKRFNVISCGYLLAGILDGKRPPEKKDAEKYWFPCMSLDTEKGGIEPVSAKPTFNIVTAKPGGGVKTFTVFGTGFSTTNNGVRLRIK